MKVKLLNTYARPGAPGWITAALSVTAGLFVLGILSIGSTEVKQQVAFDGLKKSFEEQRWVQSDTFYKQLTAQPGTLEKTVREAFFQATGVQGIPPTAGKVNYEVARLLMSGNLDAAAPLYLHNRNDTLTTFRRYSSSISRTDIEAFEALAYELETKFQAYMKDRGHLVGLSRQLKEIEQKLEQNSERFQIVARDVEDLFGLRQARITDEAELPVYASGVLAGLPQLEELPDNLANLVELREELQIAGGEVSVRGPSAAEEFTLKLEMLKKSAGAFVEDHRSLFDEKERLSAEIITLQKQRRSTGATLQEGMNELVLAEMGNASAIQRYLQLKLA